MKTKEGRVMNIGDRVRIGTLETTIEGFENDFGDLYVVTEYGNFLASLVVPVPSPSQEVKG